MFKGLLKSLNLKPGFFKHFSEAKYFFCSLLFIDGAEYNTNIILLGDFYLFLNIKKAK